MAISDRHGAGPSAFRDPISERHAARHRRAWIFQVLAAIAGVAFVPLAIVAHFVPYFPWDLTISRAVQSFRPAWLDWLAGAVSWIGFPPESNVIFGAIVLALFLLHWRREAVFALVAAAGSAALWFAIAPMVDRPRPSADLIQVAAVIHWGGFPSGHVTNLTAFFGFLFFLAWVHLRRSAWRSLALLVCGSLVFGIGYARIYSGEHWPSDVLGGYMLGSVWLALTVHAYRWRLQRVHHGEAALTGTGPAVRTVQQAPADVSSQRAA